jgi:anti-sigma B factor antagonist
VSVDAPAHGGVLHLVLEVNGSLDTKSAPRVKREALARIDKGADVVFDLSRVEFVDSVGLGALVSLFKVVRDAGHRANFTGVRPAVARVLGLIHLDTIFEVHPDLKSASRALR